MGVVRKTVTGAVAAAFMISSATPALADWGRPGGGGFGGRGGPGGYGGYGGYGGGERHHEDHDNVGGIIAGIAIIGVIAAIAASASKNSNSQRTSDGSYPDRANQQRGSINSENAAVDACAQAAENRGGQSASVRNITAVDKNNDGWEVEGVIEQRTGWRDSTPDKHRFTCSVRYGAVDSVYIESDKVAYGY
jgi:hypothetical protein